MYKLVVEGDINHYYADAKAGDTAIGMIRFDFGVDAVLSNIQAYGAMYFQDRSDYRGKGIATVLLLAGLLNVADRGYSEFYGTLTPTPYSDTNARDNALRFYEKVGVEHSKFHKSYDLRGNVRHSIALCKQFCDQNGLVISNNAYRLRT